MINFLEHREAAVVDNIITRLESRDLVALSFVNETYLEIVQGRPGSQRRRRYVEALKSLKLPLQNPNFMPVRKRVGEQYYRFVPGNRELYCELFLHAESIIGKLPTSEEEAVVEPVVPDQPQIQRQTMWPAGWEPRQHISLTR